MTKKLSIIFIPGLISLAVVFAIYFIDGLNEQSISTSIRATARISLLFFILVYFATLVRAFRFNKIINQHFKPLITYRRQWGLAFGVTHIIHLETIFMFIAVVHGGDWQAMGSAADLAPAAFIYVMLFLMMLTSNNYSVRLLGAKVWKYLHKFGLYLLMIGFLQSVAPKFIIGITSSESDMALPWIVFYGLTSIALIGIWITRIIIWIGNKKAQSS